MQRTLKPAVFVLCLVPLVVLLARGLVLFDPSLHVPYVGRLGPNPSEAIVRYLGDWALRFLLIALAVTPVRRLTGWIALGRLRRMLGLFAFTYVTLHMLAYIGFDCLFNLATLWRDVVKRKYITVGMAAFLMLLPLAITSTDAMVRRLGGRAWRRLHRVVYVAGVAAVLHYFMMIKAGFAQPMVYAVILAILLGSRLVRRRT